MPAVHLDTATSSESARISQTTTRQPQSKNLAIFPQPPRPTKPPTPAAQTQTPPSPPLAPPQTSPSPPDKSQTPQIRMRPARIPPPGRIFPPVPPPPRAQIG